MDAAPKPKPQIVVTKMTKLQKAAEDLLSQIPESSITDYKALFENTKQAFITDYGFDEERATELAKDGVAQAKSVADNLDAHRKFLQDLLRKIN